MKRSFFCPHEICSPCPTSEWDWIDALGPQRGWLYVELLASVFTLAGIYVGSTTALGASLYLVALTFWFALTFGKRLWGLMPLNVASLIVSVVNLWRALA